MEREKINIRNMYIELLNKIKNVEGVDKDYVDDLIEVVDLHLNALDQDLSAITNVIPEEATVTNKLVPESEIQNIELDIETISSSVSAITLDVSGINEVIPSTASSSNKLATASDIPTAHNPVSNMLSLNTSGWSYNSTLGTYEKTVSISHINISLPMYLVPYPSRDPQTDTESAMFRLIKYADVASNGNSVTIGCSKQPDNSFACYLNGYN